MSEFKPYPKIERIGKFNMQISQKIHGTNAQVYIYKDETGELQLKVGSRTRWITPDSDNYGFAAFIYANREEFITKLGVGQHFGEWAGPGINSGEGLTEKTFILFDAWKFPPERPLPLQTKVVPVLYQGSMDLKQIDETMNKLKETGSQLVPGFMRPEGIVIILAGTRYKKVFEAEETKWKKGDEAYKAKKLAEKEAGPDLSHLLQPVRLEKLLSRDEQYVINFPSSVKTICDDYIKDLVEEGQIANDEIAIKQVRRSLGGDLFKFIRETVEKTKGNSFL